VRSARRRIHIRRIPALDLSLRRKAAAEAKPFKNENKGGGDMGASGRKEKKFARGKRSLALKRRGKRLGGVGSGKRRKYQARKRRRKHHNGQEEDSRDKGRRNQTKSKAKFAEEAGKKKQSLSARRRKGTAGDKGQSSSFKKYRIEVLAFLREENKNEENPHSSLQRRRRRRSQHISEMIRETFKYKGSLSENKKKKSSAQAEIERNLSSVAGKGDSTFVWVRKGRSLLQGEENKSLRAGIKGV